MLRLGLLLLVCSRVLLLLLLHAAVARHDTDVEFMNIFAPRCTASSFLFARCVTGIFRFAGHHRASAARVGGMELLLLLLLLPLRAATVMGMRWNLAVGTRHS